MECMQEEVSSVLHSVTTSHKNSKFEFEIRVHQGERAHQGGVVCEHEKLLLGMRN
jgi:hypothetical protein